VTNQAPLIVSLTPQGVAALKLILEDVDFLKEVNPALLGDYFAVRAIVMVL
jgi:hypothetical protein